VPVDPVDPRDTEIERLRAALGAIAKVCNWRLNNLARIRVLAWAGDLAANAARSDAQSIRNTVELLAMAERR